MFKDMEEKAYRYRDLWVIGSREVGSRQKEAVSIERIINQGLCAMLRIFVLSSELIRTREGI